MKLIFDIDKKTVFNADNLISVEIDDIDNHLCFTFFGESTYTRSYFSYEECEEILDNLCHFLTDDISVSYILPKPKNKQKKEADFNDKI